MDLRPCPALPCPALIYIIQKKAVLLGNIWHDRMTESKYEKLYCNLSLITCIHLPRIIAFSVFVYEMTHDPLQLIRN